MFKLLKNVLTTACFTIIITSCAHLNIDNQNLSTKSTTLNNLNNASRSDFSMQDFKNTFINTNAFTKLNNNPDNIEYELLNTTNESLPETQIQCVKDNFNKSVLDSYVINGFNTITKNYPEKVELWASEMDFLAEVSQKINDNPLFLGFSVKNISQSTAFQDLNELEAVHLKKLILNPDFEQLLLYLGLPGTNYAGETYSIFNLVYMDYETEVEISKQKCGIST